ncbi:peptidoglycan editing factor PgeF [Nodosilinea sp. LEGE 07088]|uniref:peptidoglycan editing factor PgeF n=1 Tax=Nodosilinea sp. LEGE 07088 TaxID=2777968 RepID=UPI001880DB04|nr:peptidoglycan editing factor PgeF [Nodosilinea sp. LEGE 07088]MBE9137421.1 peptidoglycan editing factor PgeF [Nodosilinea sp. LEGE 07088]
MADWYWRPWQGQEFLTCGLLQPWPHGFFTRQFWPRLPPDLGAALAADATVQRVKQVHGNRVLCPADLPGENPTGGLAEADGLISDRAQQSLWVCSADCSPVLIGDRATGQVAAIHAGWRGTAQAIVPVAVSKLQAQGSRLEDLVVAIGPAIAGSVYQVANEVAAAVGRPLMTQAADNDGAVDDGAVDDGAAIEALFEQDHAFLLPDENPGKVRLDVRLANLEQLVQLGLSREQVAVAPHCTFQEPDRFFSYRRTGEKQVQWSGIVSQGSLGI